MLLGIILLLATTTPPTPAVLCLDTLHSIDVSDQYTFTPTIFRIVLEPVVGTVRVLLFSTDGLLAICVGYLLIRLFFSIHQKKSKTNIMPQSLAPLWEGMLSGFVGLLFLSFIVTLISLLIGFAIGGFLVIGKNAFIIMEWIANGLTLFFIGILVCGVVMLRNPAGKITAVLNRMQNQYYRWRSRRKGFQLIEKKGSVRKVAREGRRLVVVFGFVGFFILIGVFAPNPPKKLSTSLDPDELLFDFHVHTSRSDGMISPQERVRWYLDQGIHGAAFSDHHTTRGAREAQAYVDRFNLDFTVIVAQEYTISEPRVHLNIYGLTEDINPPEYYPGIKLESPLFADQFLNVSDMIRYVKDRGAYVTVNHYKHENPYTWAQFRDWGVDGFEIANGGSEQNRDLTAFCLANHLICIGGTDMHEGDDLNTFVRFRLDDPANRSLDAIFAALRKNEHQVVVIRPQIGSQGVTADLFPDMSRYFASVNSAQRWSWIIWVVGIYTFGTIIYFQARKCVRKQFLKK
jgi:hypothetical protein